MPLMTVNQPYRKDNTTHAIRNKHFPTVSECGAVPGDDSE